MVDASGSERQFEPDFRGLNLAFSPRSVGGAELNCGSGSRSRPPELLQSVQNAFERV